jgi:hypothetical protein
MSDCPKRPERAWRLADDPRLIAFASLMLTIPAGVAAVSLFGFSLQTGSRLVFVACVIVPLGVSLRRPPGESTHDKGADQPTAPIDAAPKAQEVPANSDGELDFRPILHKDIPVPKVIDLPRPGRDSVRPVPHE